MCSYRPWWWWMASSRSCSSEGKSTSPHALHHESTLLMYCRGRNAHLHSSNCHSDVKHFTRDVLYTSLCSSWESHVSQTYQSAQEIACGAFPLPLLSLNTQKCPFIWLWALLRLFSEELFMVECAVHWPVVPSLKLSVPPCGRGGKQNLSEGLALKKYQQAEGISLLPITGMRN